MAAVCDGLRSLSLSALPPELLMPHTGAQYAEDVEEGRGVYLIVTMRLAKTR